MSLKQERAEGEDERPKRDREGCEARQREGWK